MRRADFDDRTRSIDDIMSVVSEEELWDFFDEIIDSATVNEYIYDDIRDFDGSWESLRDYLNNLVDPDEFPYFEAQGSFDYRGLTDDDIGWLKDRLYNVMSDNDYWEEEPEEEIDEAFIDYESDDDDDEIEADSSADFIGLYTANSGLVNVLAERKDDDDRKAYIEFSGYVHGIIG